MRLARGSSTRGRPRARLRSRAMKGLGHPGVRARAREATGKGGSSAAHLSGPGTCLRGPANFRWTSSVFVRTRPAGTCVSWDALEASRARLRSCCSGSGPFLQEMLPMRLFPVRALSTEALTKERPWSQAPRLPNLVKRESALPWRDRGYRLGRRRSGQRSDRPDPAGEEEGVGELRLYRRCGVTVHCRARPLQHDSSGLCP